MADWLLIVISSLAVWRLTHMVAREDGPWNLVVKLRIAAGQSWVGHLMDCFKCLSLWVALPFAFVVDGGWNVLVILWLALSGVAIVIEELVTQQDIFGGDENNGMLRRSESDAAVGN